MTEYVVCIYGGRWGRVITREPVSNAPKKGQVYTVVGDNQLMGQRYLKLAELGERFFIARAFRPLDPQRIERLKDVTQKIPA